MLIRHDQLFLRHTDASRRSMPLWWRWSMQGMPSPSQAATQKAAFASAPSVSSARVLFYSLISARMA